MKSELNATKIAFEMLGSSISELEDISDKDICTVIDTVEIAIARANVLKALVDFDFYHTISETTLICSLLECLRESLEHEYEYNIKLDKSMVLDVVAVIRKLYNWVNAYIRR